MVKISIELELRPDEVPMATELLKTLRMLTDHVGGDPPVVRNRADLFKSLMARLADPAQLQNVVAEVVSLLTEAGSNRKAAVQELVSALNGTIFSAEMAEKAIIAEGGSVQPYLQLLVHLPDEFQKECRDLFIPEVIKSLTVKRTVDADRREFLQYAESFAALVKLDMVKIHGAVDTMITLLGKTENRCAAVTMLGKTVEICYQQLREQASLEKKEQLRRALQGVTEEAFKYDLKYVNEFFGWTATGGGAPAAAAAAAPTTPAQEAAPASTAPAGLGFAASYPVVHQQFIWTMVLDEPRHQLLSGSQDGMLVVWGSNGQAVASVPPVGDYYSCGMASVGGNIVVGAGISKTGPGALLVYQNAQNIWQHSATVAKPGATLVSTVKGLLGNDGMLATGETHDMAAATGGEPNLKEKICLYDLNDARFYSSMEPVICWEEHEDLISCMGLMPSNKNVFLTGSKDQTVRVWDKRCETSIGMFGLKPKSGGVALAHNDLVTTISAGEYMVVTGGMDQILNHWDFRLMGQRGSAGTQAVASVNVDGTPVVKTAMCGGQGMAAVATSAGLFTVGLGGASGAVVQQTAPPPQVHAGLYQELVWSPTQRCLFASGDQMRVDIYAVP